MNRAIAYLASIPVGLAAYFVAAWLPMVVAFLAGMIAWAVIEALLERNRP